MKIKTHKLLLQTAMTAHGVKKTEGNGGGYFQIFPYTDEQAGHNHFHPCSTGNVSSGKGKCSLHGRNATILAKERSDGLNSFPTCPLRMKTTLFFKSEISKSVSVIAHCCCLGQHGVGLHTEFLPPDVDS